MPLPVIHSYAGYTIYKSLGLRTRGHRFLILAAAVFLANAPDFDFIPGLIFGQASMFHRTASHSLVAAVLVGVFCGLIAAAFPLTPTLTRVPLRVTPPSPLRGEGWGEGRRHPGEGRREGRPAPLQIGFAAFLLYSSHIVLDAMNGGVPLLWPLSGNIVSTGTSWFPQGGSFGGAATLSEFFAGLCGSSCLMRVYQEIILVSTCVLLTKLWGFMNLSRSLKASLRLRRIGRTSKTMKAAMS